MSNLVKHAEREMKLAGLYDEDSDYGGMIPKAVMELVKAHSEQRHSGGSHAVTMGIFNKVINFENLTPITNNPDEWTNVSEYGGKDSEPVWQSQRNSALFSNDGGKTYYSVDDKDRKLVTAKQYEKGEV